MSRAMPLPREERERIRMECRRRYRSVDSKIARGEEAVKSYGNWAGPTIESLLDTCDWFEGQLLAALAKGESK